MSSTTLPIPKYFSVTSSSIIHFAVKMCERRMCFTLLCLLVHIPLHGVVKSDVLVSYIYLLCGRKTLNLWTKYPIQRDYRNYHYYHSITAIWTWCSRMVWCTLYFPIRPFVCVPSLSSVAAGAHCGIDLFVHRHPINRDSLSIFFSDEFLVLKSILTPWNWSCTLAIISSAVNLKLLMRWWLKNNTNIERLRWISRLEICPRKAEYLRMSINTGAKV